LNLFLGGQLSYKATNIPQKELILAAMFVGRMEPNEEAL
jgi:hypothetical protein